MLVRAVRKHYGARKVKKFWLLSWHFGARLSVMNIQAYLDELRARVRECPTSRDQLALATQGALSPSWINKFAAGRMRNPRVDSLVALDQALLRVATSR